MNKHCRKGDKIWIRCEVYVGGDQPSAVTLPFGSSSGIVGALRVGSDYKL